ncbi:MAG: nuoL [Phycisphaerales bacterium]|nr:nuoL [Phycisphaerales bacterium]
MEHLWVVRYSWLIPLLPLIGAAAAGLLGAKWLKERSHLPIWIGVGISAILSLALLFSTIGLLKHEPADKSEHENNGLSGTKEVFNWIEVGDPNQQGTEGHPQTVQGNPAAYFLAKAGFFFDPLTVTMLCVVTGIGFFITVFAAGYMKGESGYFRFFAYLGLFIFMMTILVMGSNLVMLYLGWEGVGLCSYLLIGYYYEKPAAREAAKKAFLVNRIGDFGFGIGIMLCYLAFGTVSYFGQGAGTHTGLLELATSGHLTGFQSTALYWIPFCLMLGAFGKSAQFPLYVWLPDAMEGPTPVSALIHAATMVTAGVYMIARCGTLFVGNPLAMTTIAVVGAFTAIFAASIALRQFDLKKVFAYSTISQLGFMFVAVGVLAPVAGVFHLITHAFFKALLFLSSGVVMHAMAGELDMRKMSGVKKVLPITNILMLIGCLALAGCPPFSGFFSKDEILGAAFRVNWVIGAVLLFTAFMTAYYTFRLYFRVFRGPLVVPEAPAAGHGHGHETDEHASASHSAIATGTSPSSGVDVGQTKHAPAHGHHADHGHHNHEPLIMILPLVVLAVGACLAGGLNFGERLGHFLGESPSLIRTYEKAKLVYAGTTAISAASFGQEATGGKAPETEYSLMAISAVVSLAGIGLAYLLHLKSRLTGERIAAGLSPLTHILEAKYWVDEIYQAMIIEPLRSLGRWLWGIDRFIVDGLVNAVGAVPQIGGFLLKLTIQRGYLQGYAAAMLFGVAIILFLIFLH